MNTKQMMNRQPRVALVIGAGGVKCAAALGVYSELRKAGVLVDLFVGCSGGSIYASFLAMGYSAAQAEQVVTELWTRELTQVKNGSGYLMSLMPRSKQFKKNFALRDDRLILERLHEAFGSRRIEEMPIPLLVNATNFDSGDVAVFHEGFVVDAIRASIAIPSVFRPWEIDGRLYSDGIISNPLPIDVAARAGADVIVAVGFSVPMRARVHNANRFNLHVNSILTNNLLRAQVELCEQAFEADVLVLEPELNGRIGTFDTHKIPQLIEAGKRSMKQQLGHLEMCLQRRMQFSNAIVSFMGAHYSSQV